MFELPQEIPDYETVLAIETEELALVMLRILKRRGEGDFHPNNSSGELFNQRPPPYPQEYMGEISQAVAEALCWLESQVLVVPASGMNGSNGWRRLSRRAKQMQTPDDFANFRAGQLLPKELLHWSIRERVWLLIVGGRYDTAVFESMKQVEVSVRDACAYGDGEIGVALMRRAFGKGGPLADASAQQPEQEALTALFAGAIGSYKNPHSHRHVALDASEAAQIVLLASHLLSIVDSRAVAASTP